MIDLKLLREDPEAVRASQRARGADPSLVDAAVAADAALALGPNRTPQQQRETPTTVHHRTEDGQRTAQRAAAERKLTRPAVPASAAVPRTTPGTTSTAPTPRPRRPDRASAEHPAITVESAATAAERVQHLVQPADANRRQRGTGRPMQR